MSINIQSETGLYTEKMLFKLSVDKILSKFCEQLNLSGLQSITLVHNAKLPEYSLARPVNNFKDIIVSDILFLYIRKRLDKQTYYLEKLDEAIFHELIHINFRNQLQNLHKIAEKDTEISENDIFRNWTTVFWIEYIVSNVSLQISSTAAMNEMAISIVNNKWSITTQSDMWKFLKYVTMLISIVKVQGGDGYQKWIGKIEDVKIKQTILQIAEIINFIENSWGASFDEYEYLKPLESYIIESYHLLIV